MVLHGERRQCRQRQVHRVGVGTGRSTTEPVTLANVPSIRSSARVASGVVVSRSLTSMRAEASYPLPRCQET